MLARIVTQSEPSAYSDAECEHWSEVVGKLFWNAEYEMIKLFDDVSLRLLQLDDAKDIYDTIDTQRDYLGRWLPFVADTRSAEYTREFVESAVVAEDKTYTIRKGDKFIGLIGFKPSDRANRKTELGYWLSEPYQGQGVMTRAVEALCRLAFDELGMNRVQIKCAVGNTPSRSVALRLGFEFEGVERAGELFPDGSFADIEVYSIVKAHHL